MSEAKSKAAKQRWDNPEYRKKVIARMKEKSWLKGLKGENHPAWKGKDKRTSYSYLLKSILERDDYTCRICGLRDRKSVV